MPDCYCWSLLAYNCRVPSCLNHHIDSHRTTTPPDTHKQFQSNSTSINFIHLFFQPNSTCPEIPRQLEADWNSFAASKPRTCLWGWTEEDGEVATLLVLMHLLCSNIWLVWLLNRKTFWLYKNTSIKCCHLSPTVNNSINLEQAFKGFHTDMADNVNRFRNAVLHTFWCNSRQQNVKASIVKPLKMKVRVLITCSYELKLDEYKRPHSMHIRSAVKIHQLFEPKPKKRHVSLLNCNFVGLQDSYLVRQVQFLA